MAKVSSTGDQSSQSLAQDLQLFQEEVARLEVLLAQQTQQSVAQQQRIKELENKLEREQRRYKQAEEEQHRLQGEVKRLQQTILAMPAVTDEVPAPPPELIAGITEAVTALQRCLALAKGNAIPKPPEERPAAPKAAAPLKKPHKPTKPVAGTVTLPSPHGLRTYNTATVIGHLLMNDEQLLSDIRDGIVYLEGDPVKARTTVAAFTRAGIPDVLLNAPLRPAVIDGSNVANLDPSQRRAKYALLTQTQRAAWREGYFPVIMIVDASLPHQIDRADLLLEMVERGQIMMAHAGTSADEMLIDEAMRLHAVLITNDRMTEWPAAKDLEKRHVELVSGSVSIGSFHRSSGFWFR